MIEDIMTGNLVQVIVDDGDVIIEPIYDGVHSFPVQNINPQADTSFTDDFWYK